MIVKVAGSDETIPDLCTMNSVILGKRDPTERMESTGDNRFHKRTTRCTYKIIMKPA